MPSKSQAQQQFFAICEHNPRHARGKCPNMSKEKMHEFAATKRTGLPKYVDQRKRANERRAKANKA